MDDKLFCNCAGMKLDIKSVARELIYFIKQDENRRYKIVVGSDSEGWSGQSVDFVTAIVIHRVGNGGRYFWRRVEFDKFYTLRDRIIQEVLLSLEVAKEILSALKSFESVKFDFEIHVDIGENGETKSMIQEVVGMIRAYNFEARTKPESYAASNVADRYV